MKTDVEIFIPQNIEVALGGSSILAIYTYNYDNCLTKMPKIFFKESICFTKITFAFNGLSFV